MTEQNLIYPGKDQEMIVRVKCGSCQFEGEAAEFLKFNKWKNTCPQCGEVVKLTAILNNRKLVPFYREKNWLDKNYSLVVLISFLLTLLYSLYNYFLRK